jgi:carbon-monoxide dehydrogenase small subunit
MKLDCMVNAQVVEADVAPRLLLSDFLRHELKLTGTHVGCEMGACGACTVIVDDSPVRSCLMFAAQADGCQVRTVESLAGNPKGRALQDAFHQHHGLQCGYCTPGVLTTLTAALERGELPDNEEDMRILLSGNICRCTGYQGIVDAAMAVVAQQRGAGA